jgi:hypothetical protein
MTGNSVEHWPSQQRGLAALLLERRWVLCVLGLLLAVGILPASGRQDATPTPLGTPLFLADFYDTDLSTTEPLASDCHQDDIVSSLSATSAEASPAARPSPPPIIVPAPPRIPASAVFLLYCLAFLGLLGLFWDRIAYALRYGLLWLNLRCRHDSPAALLYQARQLYGLPPGTTAEELLLGQAGGNKLLAQRLKEYQDGFSPR